MIVVRITMNALPEKQLEVLQTLLSMIEPTSKEPGCLNFTAFSDIQDKNCFGLIQEWKTRQDLNHHIRSHRFNVLLGTKTLLSEPPDIQIHTVSLSEGVEAVDATRGKKS
ncbi:MAG: antibiotic biosynthesis monooxygenase [Desulfobacteraceae bacterium]|nr:antibiotic biosynthesis monooxygenase [Desulfobacteraceae bacterium]